MQTALTRFTFTKNLLPGALVNTYPLLKANGVAPVLATLRHIMGPCGKRF